MFQQAGIAELRGYQRWAVGEEVVVGKVQLEEKVAVQARRACAGGQVEWTGDTYGRGRARKIIMR